jgi:acyl-CoA thioesterase I
MVLSRLRVVVICTLVLIVVVAGIIWRSETGDSAESGVYVALGASDAVGIGAQRPGRDGWVALVHRDLPGNPRLVNLGMSGARMLDVLTMQVPVAIDAEPAWVSLWPGVNDLRNGVPLTTFREQLDGTLEQLAGVEGATIILLTIPDLRHLPDFAGEDPDVLNASVIEWNSVITDAAARHGALIVDLYAGAPELAENPEYVSNDGFHPSSAGYRRIAEMVMDIVDEHHALVSP